MKVCSFGECLIDFTPSFKSDKGNATFEQNPGGAPANLAVAIARLHGQSAFLGKVGQDQFGDFLVDTLCKENVDTRNMIRSKNHHTSLAFVYLHQYGERDFIFYREPGADVMIESREVNFDLIDECEVFHFGSISMTHNPARTTTLELLNYVKSKNKIITYDPNLRLPLWSHKDDARKYMNKGLKYCNILKVTEEELFFMTQKEDTKEAIEEVLKYPQISIVLCTKAEQGCVVYANGIWLEMPAFSVQSIDATGAGDAFFGSFIYDLTQLNKHYTEIDIDDLTFMITRASAAGALATMVKGAIPSLPTTKQLDHFLKDHSNGN